jgi:hypothetical protein
MRKFNFVSKLNKINLLPKLLWKHAYYDNALLIVTS